MSLGQHSPLGARIPDSIHAVSVNIPTMGDVIGYEEKDPQTMAKLTSGYPRFVVHPYLRKVEAHWKTLFDAPNHSIWLTASESMAKRLDAHLSTEGTCFLKHRGVCGLRIPNVDELNRRAKLFLQHIGGLLSTRQAEDYLLLEGQLSTPQVEKRAPADSAERSNLEFLSPLYGCPADSIVLANTGMNAFFAAFEAVRSLQAPQGRATWIKLGWLYTDTMHILDKLSGDHSENIELLDVFDISGLEKALESRGREIAGIVTEAPTNPLIQTPDLARIRELATKHNVFLFVDPTVCSPLNIDVAPYSDIIVSSLTKYAANEGDTMMGAIALTSACPQRETLLDAIRKTVEPVYPADLQRLAYQLPQYRTLVEASNRSTPQVVAFLQNHPKVKAVYWAKQESSRTNFEKIARTPEACGGLISFELHGDLAAFYDRVAIDKGPSFGMQTSLLCPYIYLAHYSLVTCEQGRETLKKAGISTDLIRLAIGSEPAADIIAALEAAL